MHRRRAALPSAPSSAPNACRRARSLSVAARRCHLLHAMRAAPREGDELDDQLSGLAGEDGMFSVCGFGSLLSERSARSTFPDLANFRAARLLGWRRVFAHTADVFWQRGVARPETREVSSLSCEPAGGAELIVSQFEVPYSSAAAAAFVEREHEFRFVAVRPRPLDGPRPSGGGDGGGGGAAAAAAAEGAAAAAEGIAAAHGRLAVLCAAWDDESYRRRRCPPDEWARRWAVFGIERVWRDDVLPCRAYLRHCVLAARSLGPEAEASFLDGTLLADRRTTIRQHLRANPCIMEELPPPELAARYNG